METLFHFHTETGDADVYVTADKAGVKIDLGVAYDSIDIALPWPSALQLADAIRSAYLRMPLRHLQICLCSDETGVNLDCPVHREEAAKIERDYLERGAS